MQIYIQDLQTGITYTVDTDPNATIDAIKYLMHDKLGYIPTDMSLIFAGKLLQGKKTLAFYNIDKDCRLQLLVKVRERPPHEEESAPPGSRRITELVHGGEGRKSTLANIEEEPKLDIDLLDSKENIVINGDNTKTKKKKKNCKAQAPVQENCCKCSIF